MGSIKERKGKGRMMMRNEDAITLAKMIIELDLLRDEIWESLTSEAGDKAYEILRNVQNS
jgi:hypothetical protein